MVVDRNNVGDWDIHSQGAAGLSEALRAAMF